MRSQKCPINRGLAVFSFHRFFCVSGSVFILDVVSINDASVEKVIFIYSAFFVNCFFYF